MSASVNKDEYRGYETCREAWAIAGHRFDLTWPADMDALLDLPETQRRFDRDEFMPYWAQPWPAAVMLAETLFLGESGDNRPAVEMGCGVGLVSLAAVMMGWSVTAGDYDQDALAFTELNARNNNVQLAACERIDFRQPLTEPMYDLILGADVTYERRLCAPAACWIASAMKPGGKAMISDPNRAVADAFISCARDAGFHVREEKVQTTLPDNSLANGRIWQLTHS